MDFEERHKLLLPSSALQMFLPCLLAGFKDFYLAGIGLFVLRPTAASVFHFPISVTNAPNEVHDLWFWTENGVFGKAGLA